MLEEIDSIPNSTAKVIECEMLNPPSNICAEFSLTDNTLLLHLVRKRERAGIFFGYYESWSAGVVMPTNTDIFINQSRHQYFRESGMRVTHVKQTISAIAATDFVAAHLGIEPGSPLLSLVRRSYHQEGNEEVLVDHLLALYNTELFQYQMDLKLD
jgi:GntR family transcriptional regulator